MNARNSDTPSPHQNHKPLPAQEKHNRVDVAIIGGGFGGVYCARTLRKMLSKVPHLQQKTIALLAEENHMVFQPMLPEVAGASLSPRHVVNPLRKMCKDVDVYKAKVTAIDLGNRTLKMSTGDFTEDIHLHYGHLVLALGAKVNLSKIPGMQEHAYLLKNVGDAIHLRSTLISRLEEANWAQDASTKKRLLSFVIVGGGYSGAELAGQIIDLLYEVDDFYENIDIRDCRVTLVHSQSHLLPTLSQDLGKYTEAKLKKRGVKIILSQRVEAVTANKVTLSNQTTIEANTVISTIGNSPHPLVTQLCKDNHLDTAHRRILTQKDCSIAHADDLWAAGDCAAIPISDTEFCSPNAQFAMRQGKLIGHNIARTLQGKATLPFTFKGMGELASLGHHDAVANIFGFKFSGFFAWWLWRTIYLGKLPGWDRKIRVLLDWTLEVFFPRDINLLNPHHSEQLQEIHLEVGDTLFNRGDPARSFYIVKSGCIDLFENGKLLKTVLPNECFGQRALMEDKIWQFDATAGEPSKLVVIGASIFTQVFQSLPSFEWMLERNSTVYLPQKKLDEILRKMPSAILQSSVADFMTTHLITLHENSAVEDALQTIKRRPHSCYPVVDDEGNVSGAIEKDTIYHKFHTTTKEGSLKIKTLYPIQLPHIRQRETIETAIRTMIRTGFSKALVFNRDDQLVGILTMMDLIHAKGLAHCSKSESEG